MHRRAAAQRHTRSGAAAARAALCALPLVALLFAGGWALPASAAAAGGAVARVKSGTGFFVSRDGFLVTSAHVVADCPDVSIWQPDGTERPAHLIAADPQADVALLWANGSVARRVAFAPRQPPWVGEPVFTLGFGVAPTQPLHAVMARGSFVGASTAERGNRVLVIRARLRAGNSGGAVLAGDGSLLGMVIGRDEERPEFGVALPGRDIETLLAAYGIGLPLGSGADAERQLSAISVLIQCTADAADPDAAAWRSFSVRRARPRQR